MSDDDIEIIDPSRAGNNDLCQLCPLNLHGLSDTERDNHYRTTHSPDKPNGGSGAKRKRPKPTPVISPRPKTTPMKFEKSTKNDAPGDVFWCPAQATPPPDNYSPGVLSILKDALKKAHRKGTMKRAVLCYERTPHILRDSLDRNWGCAYRNFLMTCAALMDQQVQTLYRQNLESPIAPGVVNLQHWIEDAWRHGYDDSGARELEHKLADTKKKIGTGDLYVAFTSRRIPCMLVDFNIKKSPKGNLPFHLANIYHSSCPAGFDAVTDWVVDYFTEKPEGDAHAILFAASPVMATSKMPVIMQWDGHSITIVGYELGKNGKYNLLVFDPSSTVRKDIRQAALCEPTSAALASSSISRGKGKNRGRSDSPAAKKRSRTNPDPEDVVSIPDSDDEKIDDARLAVALKSSVDPDGVIKAFRMKTTQRNKDDYQLLYFTMGDPLSDKEQNDRKVVLSDRVC